MVYVHNHVQNDLRQELEIAYISKIFALRLPAYPPSPPPKQCCSLAFHENNIERRGEGGQNVLKQKFFNDLPNLVR